MSVSSNLLCSFELLKPLDSSALKNHIKKGRNARQNMLNSPVSVDLQRHWMRLTAVYSRHKFLLKASKACSEAIMVNSDLLLQHRKATIFIPWTYARAEVSILYKIDKKHSTNRTSSLLVLRWRTGSLFGAI